MGGGWQGGHVGGECDGSGAVAGLSEHALGLVGDVVGDASVGSDSAPDTEGLDAAITCSDRVIDEYLVTSCTRRAAVLPGARTQHTNDAFPTSSAATLDDLLLIVRRFQSHHEPPSLQSERRLPARAATGGCES